jgi:hypothetical protein
MRNYLPRPKLDLIFDSVTFLLAFVGVTCLILADAAPMFIGLVGGVATVTGYYAVRSLISWKKYRRIMGHEEWIHTLRDMMHIQRELHHGYVRVRLGPPRDGGVNWRRDGF